MTNKQENTCTNTLHTFLSLLVRYYFVTVCDGKIQAVGEHYCVCVSHSGTLDTGEHAETGPETQLHPRQLHGGGHVGLSRWTGHIFLCQGRSGNTTMFLCCCYSGTIFIFIITLIFINPAFSFPNVISRMFWCRRSCLRTQTRCLSRSLRRPWKRRSQAARTMRWSWRAAPSIRWSWRGVISCCKQNNDSRFTSYWKKVYGREICPNGKPTVVVHYKVIWFQRTIVVFWHLYFWYNLVYCTISVHTQNIYIYIIYIIIIYIHKHIYKTIIIYNCYIYIYIYIYISYIYYIFIMCFNVFIFLYICICI